MSRAEIKSMLDGIGIPSVHMAWRRGSAPHLPWAVFCLDDDAHLCADDRRWHSHPRWRIELYQSCSDVALEEALEDALVERYGDYYKEEVWVDEEDCLMTSYIFTQL